MHTSSFEQAKELYERIKPVRGTNNIRPVGDRRRKWQHITRDNMGNSYTIRDAGYAKIVFTRDNVLHYINTGYATPSTASFFSMFGPFYVEKAKNKLWLRYESCRVVPLSTAQSEVGVSFHRNAEGKWESSIKRILVNRVNRDRAKKARLSVKDLADNCYAMLKLSDGWVMADTKAEALRELGEYQIQNTISLRELQLASTTDPELLPYIKQNTAIIRFLENHAGRAVRQSKWAERVTVHGTHVHTKQYDPEAVRRLIYKFHDLFTPDINDVVGIEPPSAPVDNVVGLLFKNSSMVTFK